MAPAWARFSGLKPTDQTVQRLCRNSSLLSMEKGQFLIEQGSEADNVYLVISGRFDAVNFTNSGHAIWLAEFEPGDMIGEIAALTGSARTSSVLAGDTSVVMSTNVATFQSIMLSSGPLATAVSRMLADRTARTSRQLEHTIGLTVNARLHHELTRMASRSADRELFTVNRPLNMSELASRIHATREATSRAMKDLEKRGLVRREDGQITIVVPHSLKQAGE